MTDSFEQYALLVCNIKLLVFIVMEFLPLKSLLFELIIDFETILRNNAWRKHDKFAPVIGQHCKSLILLRFRKTSRSHSHEMEGGPRRTMETAIYQSHAYFLLPCEDGLPFLFFFRRKVNNFFRLCLIFFNLLFTLIM